MVNFSSKTGFNLNEIKAIISKDYTTGKRFNTLFLFVILHLESPISQKYFGPTWIITGDMKANEPKDIEYIRKIQSSTSEQSDFNLIDMFNENQVGNHDVEDSSSFIKKMFNIVSYTELGLKHYILDDIGVSLRLKEAGTPEINLNKNFITDEENSYCITIETDNLNYLNLFRGYTLLCEYKDIDDLESNDYVLLKEGLRVEIGRLVKKKETLSLVLNDIDIPLHTAKVRGTKFLGIVKRIIYKPEFLINVKKRKKTK